MIPVKRSRFMKFADEATIVIIFLAVVCLLAIVIIGRQSVIVNWLYHNVCHGFLVPFGLLLVCIAARIFLRFRYGPNDAASSTGKTSPALKIVVLFLIAGAFFVLGFHIVQCYFGYDDAYFLSFAKFCNRPLVAFYEDMGMGMFYRPLFYLYYFANYQLWAGEPLGHFAVYWTLHLANAVLLIALLRSFALSQRAACLAGLLFLVHPVAAGSAMMIYGGDAPGVLFFLLGLIFFSRFVKKGGALNYIAALLCATAAILVKEMFVTFPLMAILSLLLLLRRSGRRATVRCFLFSLIPFFVVVWGIFAWRWFLLGGIGTYESYSLVFDSRAAEVSFTIRNLLNTGLGTLLYGKGQIIEVNNILAWGFLAALVLGAGLTFRRNIRTRPQILIFAVLWIVIAAIPMAAAAKASITPNNLYLPLAGFCILLSVFFEPVGKKAGGAATGILALFLVVFLFGVSYATSTAAQKIGAQRAGFYADIAEYYRSNRSASSRFYCIYRQYDDSPGEMQLPFLDEYLKTIHEDINSSDIFIANLATTSDNSICIMTPADVGENFGPLKESLLFYNILPPKQPRAFNGTGPRLFVFDDTAEAGGYAGVRFLLYRRDRTICDITEDFLERVKERKARQTDRILNEWRMSESGDLSEWLSANEKPQPDITELRGSGGLLRFHPAGPGQHVGSPDISLNPLEASYVEIRMRVANRHGIAGGLGQIIWSSDGDDFADFFKRVEFPVKTDGRFHTYRIPLKSFYWIMSGTVRQVGVSAAQFECEAEIEYLRIAGEK